MHNKRNVLPFINPNTPTGHPFLNDLLGRMHNYTPEELLLFLYKESSPELTAAIEEELKTNWSLREKLGVMKTAMERLNRLAVSPRTEAVLNVMRYAQEATGVKTASKS